MVVVVAEIPLSVHFNLFIEHLKNFVCETKFLVLLIKTQNASPTIELEIENLSTEIRLKGGELIIIQNPGALTSIENVLLERNAEKVFIYSVFKTTHRKIKIPSYFKLLKKRFKNIEILLVNIPTLNPKKTSIFEQYPQIAFTMQPFQNAMMWAFTSLLTGFALSTFFGYKTIGSIFLLVTIVYSFRSTFGPILLFSFTTFIGWFFLLVPKSQPNNAASAEDLIFLIVSLSVGGLIASLVFRVKKREDFLWQYQRNLRFLYEITTHIANSQNLENCMALIFPKIKDHLKGEVAAILKQEDEFIPLSLNRGWWLKEKENLELAKWSFDNICEVGLSTNFFPYSSALFIPIQGTDGVVGTLSFRPLENKYINHATKADLYAIAHQLGLLIERDLFLENFKKNILLEESEKLHQTIFNSLSHELKTPITALSGYSDILINDFQNLQQGKQKAVLEEVKGNVWRLNQIVTNLLDSSRIHSGRIQTNLDWFDPVEIIEASVDNHRLLQPGTYTINCSDDLPPIFVDFGLIVHCLENLITNAVLYGKNQSITVGAKVEKKDFLTLYVSDEGEGIPKEHRPQLFDRFYRVPGSPTGGSGLGLFLIKQVVELHGGEVVYSDNHPKGANFLIYLPIKKIRK